MKCIVLEIFPNDTHWLDGPLVILLEKNGADEASDGVFVRKDADYIGAAFNLAVQRSRGLTEWILVQCSLGRRGRLFWPRP